VGLWGEIALAVVSANLCPPGGEGGCRRPRNSSARASLRALPAFRAERPTLPNTPASASRPICY